MPQKTLYPAGYLSLPEHCYDKPPLQPVAEPELLGFNTELAEELGLDAAWWQSEQGLAVLAGNDAPEGCTPIAQAYAGHQFGGFVPQLGDGRALLIGEAENSAGNRYDVQLKGSGRTAYSRSGDGRSALGPVVREYIMSEAMQALGVPTTRALAMIKTGERVQRETGLDGGILTRVASSHIRVGTFEFFASQGDVGALKTLADYAIGRCCTNALKSENKYLFLYESVINAQALLVAKWMSLGFVHGVMNTDNTTISGETIDYGPCAFMEAYDPATCFSSIDRAGRYAYGNQPSIMQWNLTGLGECLLPLINEDVNKAAGIAGEAMSEFASLFAKHYAAAMRAKLGLHTEDPSDRELIGDFLELLKESKSDFTNSFNDLSHIVKNKNEVFDRRFDDWFDRWHERLKAEKRTAEEITSLMRSVNPVYIPRNHRVEEAISAAYVGDMSVCERLMKVLKTPYEEQVGARDYTETAPDDAPTYRTFCGT